MNDHSDDLLVWLKAAGAGDYAQVRCILGDLKRSHPTRKLVLAAQARYHDLLKCHPSIDQLMDVDKTEPDHFAFCYDLDRPCALSSIHGTNTIDSFATSLGIKVTDYDMQFKLSEEEVDQAWQLTQGKKTIAIAPVSSTKVRDLTPEARHGVCERLLGDGWRVVLLHERRLDDLPREVLQPSLTFRQLIAAHHAVDALITVDTGHLHIGAGIGKPTVGIFSTQCGHIYTKHYPRCLVIQRHPMYTKCKSPDISGITADEILQEFHKLEIK